MNSNPYEPSKEATTRNHPPAVRPQTLAILFMVPIGITFVIAILICGVVLYTLLFVGVSFE